MSIKFVSRKNAYNYIVTDLYTKGSTQGYDNLLYIPKRDLDIPPEFGNRQRLVYSKDQALSSLWDYFLYEI